jgi:hypothetical protein
MAIISLHYRYAFWVVQPVLRQQWEQPQKRHLQKQAEVTEVAEAKQPQHQQEVEQEDSLKYQQQTGLVLWQLSQKHSTCIKDGSG